MWLAISILGGILAIGLISSSNKQFQNEIKLSENIGVTTPNCPYCNIELPKFPGRKTKCRNCGNFIYVRTRPIDSKRILVREDQIQTIEDEWAIKGGYYEDVKRARTDFEEAKAQLIKIHHTDNIPKNDILWFMYNQQRLKYAAQKEWHEYGVCCEGMADVLFDEKKYKPALALYLESAYFDLCCQGNVDGFVSPSIIRRSHRIGFTSYFFECISNLKMSLEELEQLFYNLELININFPVDRKEAWKYLKIGIQKDKKLFDFDFE